MKNNIKCLVFFLFSVTFVCPTYSQGRRVDWLHGFAGDPLRWSKFSARFQADRQMSSTVTSYTVAGSINNITSSITSVPASATNNFAIGHSLGGVVSRNFEATGNPVFDGVITVHSPNQGASIASAVNNGSAAAFFIHITTTITQAIDGINWALASEYAVINFIHGLYNGVIDGMNSILEEVFGALGPGFDQVLPHVNEAGPSAEAIMAQISGAFALISNPATQNVIDDLDPTNGFIANLNNYNSLPRIEVYGHEKNHEMYRLACSQKSKVWLNPLAETTAYPDDCVKNDVDEACRSLWWANVYIGTKATIASASIIRLKRGIKLWGVVGDVSDARDLLQGDLESGYEDLLGTQWTPVTTTQTGFSPQCQAQINALNSQIAHYTHLEIACQHPGGNPDDCDYEEEIAELEAELYALQTSAACIVTTQVTTYVPVDNSSAFNDGFILESEMTTGNALATYQNLGVGVNHMEALNHPESWKNFNAIFDRVQGDFFRTEKR